MKRLYLCIASLILCFIPALAGAQANNSSRPQIVFDRKHFDLREVDEGKTVEHTFRVFNRGDQPLLIERVAPG